MYDEQARANKAKDVQKVSSIRVVKPLDCL